MMRKINIESVLLQIANTLVLNTGIVSKSGLLEGKMGIALFLFHYSQLTGNKNYRTFATELLNEVTDDLGEDTISATFLYGLTGIAWGIRYLTAKKIIVLDNGVSTDDILEEVDLPLKNINQSDIFDDVKIEYPFCSKAIYFTEKNDKATVERILFVLNQSLSQNTMTLPLSYWNSILYVILYSNNKSEMPNSFLDIVYENIIDSIKNKSYNFSDAILLTDIIEQMEQNQDGNFDYKKWDILLKMLNYDDLTGIFNMGIYKLIYNKIKSNDTFVLSKLERIDIETQVRSMVKDVYRNLNLYNGLAGVGLTLINYFQEFNETI